MSQYLFLYLWVFPILVGHSCLEEKFLSSLTYASVLVAENLFRCVSMIQYCQIWISFGLLETILQNLYCWFHFFISFAIVCGMCVFNSFSCEMLATIWNSSLFMLTMQIVSHNDKNYNIFFSIFWVNHLYTVLIQWFNFCPVLHDEDLDLHHVHVSHLVSSTIKLKQKDFYLWSMI